MGAALFVKLRVLTEPAAGQEFALRTGDEARVGRLSGANDFAVPDAFLGPTHFSVKVGATSCTLEDLSEPLHKHPRCEAGCFLAELRNAPCPRTLCCVHDMSGENGVYVNRLKVKAVALADGDVIVAGTSAFQVAIGEAELPSGLAKEPRPPAEPARLLTPDEQSKALAFLEEQTALLRKAGTPLYAIVDAARDPGVRPLLALHDALHYSLYDGPEGDKLGDIAPYLVELEPGSKLLATLVRDHFGQAWFTLVFCQFDFKTLRRHLRRFLMVEGERGQQMYFRYYDPRVLRAYLPTCTADESREFLGPVSSFVVESEHRGEAWVFSHQADRQNPRGALRQERIRF